MRARWRTRAIEFRFVCKQLVLANGATDLYNELRVKGEHLRYKLRSIRELEYKIRDDLARLQKDPLLIVGCGLSATDAILLAQKHHIRIIHVIRRSVHDADIIFNKLPKKIYPEYNLVYEQMQRSSKQHQQREPMRGVRGLVFAAVCVVVVVAQLECCRRRRKKREWESQNAQRWNHRLR